MAGQEVSVAGQEASAPGERASAGAKVDWAAGAAERRRAAEKANDADETEGGHGLIPAPHCLLYASGRGGGKVRRSWCRELAFPFRDQRDALIREGHIDHIVSERCAQ